MNLKLEEYAKFHSTSYVIETYIDGKESEIVFGNRETVPEVKECTSDTLFDVASLTKVYTAVLIYKAYEEKRLDIYDFVKNIDDRFSHLDKVRIIDLLGHKQEIWTDGYLGNANTQEEFYKILFSAFVKNSFPIYVDVHYIILSTLLEKVYDKSYEELLKIKIFNKLELDNTTLDPDDSNVASNNYETLDGKVVDNILPGQIHDYKARKAKELGIYTGHASLFTTGSEFLTFLRSFLNNSLLKKDTIDLMLSYDDANIINYNFLRSLVDETDINSMYEKAKKINPELKIVKTYNNMGTRYKNMISSSNDIPDGCSSNSITFSGYTGPSFVIDFDRRIIVVIMCNAMHNTKLTRSEKKKASEDLMNEIFESINNKENA